MDAARWLRLSPLLDQLLDLQPDARAERLDQLALSDPEDAIELRRLLGLGAARDDFLREPLAPPRTAPGAPSLLAGDRIGRYELVRLLGEGGMGTVWLASHVDGAYRREVALKLLRVEDAGPELKARFARERRILAQLSHPNIARLFDAGVDARQRPYIALEYVEGESLTAHAARRNLDLPARIELFLQVCAAVAYAHAHLVVHRDLKPSNILVTPDGEVRLLDFGIAKLLDHETVSGEPALTRVGARAYTLNYAAPEQVRGEPVSTQTDVYALGVVLYELLTGARPYRLRRGSAAEMEAAILQAQPRRASRLALRGDDSTITDPDAQAGESTSVPIATPSRDLRAARALARQLAGDLDNILLKALQKHPEQRYASVQELAEDLRRHLAGRPVRARPDRFGYRAGKFLRRNALGVAAASLAVLLLLASSLLLFWQGQRALDESRRAQAMQDFMLGLVEHADPDVAQGGDISVADLLRDGAQRARVELHGQPQVQGELLLTIARLQSRSGRFEDALAVLDGLPIGDAGFARRVGLQRARVLLELGRGPECLQVLESFEATPGVEDTSADGVATLARLREACRGNRD